ncbi:MAG: hypothetical protein ACFFDU_06915 [Candidatus Thorarchaeota archaeon]
MTRHEVSVTIIVFILASGLNIYALQTSPTTAYTPTINEQTSYDYGFISQLHNQTAADIAYWTTLSLAESNYTMNWHQVTNLSIRVSHLIPSGPDIQAFYNFSVTVFSNVVVISNSTWETTITLNGSVPAPAPTGVSSGLVEYPTSHGLPGFFLDDNTLSTITIGSNQLIGGSLWQTVTHTTVIASGSEQLCYQLFNTTSTSNQIIDTAYVIDHDVGIYYQANETTVVTFDSIATSLTYYYEVLNTTVALVPAPSPWPIIIVAVVAAVILIGVIILVVRSLWLRRKQGSL